MHFKALAPLFVFMSFFVSSFAQVKWDVKAGLNYSNVSAKDRDGKTANTSSVPGIYLGLGASLPLSGQFSIHPSLVYARRGFKQEGSSHISWGQDFEARVSYLELPVDLMYTPKIGPGNLILALGPYLGYGTGGQWKTKGTVLIGDIMIDGKGDIAFQNDSSYGSDMNTFVYARPWDYGAHLRVGYAFLSKYAVSIDVQQGIADLQPKFGDYQPESTLRNRSVGVSIGYNF